MSISEWIGLIGGIIGIISILYVYQQTKIADKQLFISVARDIHERYYALHPLLANLPKEGVEKLADPQKQAISQYVNLCAEEFLWKTKGIIQAEVWEVWEYAIMEKFSDPIIIAAWKQYHRNDKYYKGFTEFIENIIAKR